MAGSFEDPTNNELQSRDDALVSPTSPSSAKTKTNGQNNRELSTETPPRKISSARDSSPKNVMDIAVHSFQVGQDVPSQPERMAGSDDKTARVDVSETANVDKKSLDTSSGNRRLSARVRASVKPSRYREQSDEDTSPVIPEKSSKDSSRASLRKKTPSKATTTTSSTNAGLPDPKNIKVNVAKKPAAKKDVLAEGSWTEQEQAQFKKGCIAHGWGNWQGIDHCIPSRTRKQVKSHAQKFSKHHPQEKEKMIKLFNKRAAPKQPKKKIAPTKNVTAKSESPQSAKTGRKRNVPAKTEASEPARKQAKVSKPEPSAREVNLLYGNLINKDLSVAPELKPSSPRKRAKVAAKRAPPAKGEKSIVHEKDTPNGGMVTNQSVAKPAIQPVSKRVPSIKEDKGSSTIQTAVKRLSPRKKEKSVTNVSNNTGKSAVSAQSLANRALPTKKEATVPRATNRALPTNKEKVGQTGAKRLPPAKKKEPVQRKIKRAAPLKKIAPPKKRGKTPEYKTSCTPGVGEWTEKEKQQFEKGCIMYGWGNWIKIESAVPNRTNAQIKSHAQKFRKHHLGEVERLKKEHAWRCGLNKRLASSDKSSAKGKKKSATEAKNGKVSSRKNSTSSWSLTEQKQFEDGCIFHGWGKWVYIARSHIPTKTISQIKIHADKYQLDNSEKREMLEREHKRHYLDDDEETSGEEETSENAKVHHILLGIGGQPDLKADSSAEMHNQSDTEHAQPPQASPAKTTDDDYGAAEAMMALNFARWAPSCNAGAMTEGFKASDDESVDEDESVVSQVEGGVNPRAEDIGLKEISSVASSEVDEVVEKAGEHGATFECHESSLSKVDKVAEKAGEDSAAFECHESSSSKVDEVAAKAGEDSAAFECYESSLPEPDKEMCVKSNNEDELLSQESNFSAMAFSKGSEDLNSLPPTEHPQDEAPAAELAPTRTHPTPPPHWLAAESLVECLGNIKRWNEELSEEEQNFEILKYGNLSLQEKDRVRTKLEDLRSNRP